MAVLGGDAPRHWRHDRLSIGIRSAVAAHCGQSKVWKMAWLQTRCAAPFSCANEGWSSICPTTEDAACMGKSQHQDGTPSPGLCSGSKMAAYSRRSPPGLPRSLLRMSAGKRAHGRKCTVGGHGLTHWQPRPSKAGKHWVRALRSSQDSTGCGPLQQPGDNAGRGRAERGLTLACQAGLLREGGAVEDGRSLQYHVDRARHARWPPAAAAAPADTGGSLGRAASIACSAWIGRCSRRECGERGLPGSGVTSRYCLCCDRVRGRYQRSSCQAIAAAGPDLDLLC